MERIKAEGELQQWLEQWLRTNAHWYSIDNTARYSELIHHNTMLDGSHLHTYTETVLNIGELARDLCLYLSE